jgi:hypothetical protein
VAVTRLGDKAGHSIPFHIDHPARVPLAPRRLPLPVSSPVPTDSPSLFVPSHIDYSAPFQPTTHRQANTCHSTLTPPPGPLLLTPTSRPVPTHRFSDFPCPHLATHIDKPSLTRFGPFRLRVPAPSQFVPTSPAGPSPPQPDFTSRLAPGSDRLPAPPRSVPRRLPVPIHSLSILTSHLAPSRVRTDKPVRSTPYRQRGPLPPTPLHIDRSIQ